jgi:hypothetical protein
MGSFAWNWVGITFLTNSFLTLLALMTTFDMVFVLISVASKLVSEQCVDNKGPHRLVLEAPFNNILDEVRHHPLSFPFRPIPGFEWLFIEPLEVET